MRKGSSLTRLQLKDSVSRVLLLLCFFSSASIASSGNEAIDWVQKMSRAMQELSYKGRFVYQHNSQLESMSILHVNDAKGKRERLISLNGEAREILRDNANLTCVWPSSRQVVVEKQEAKKKKKKKER